MAIYEKRLQQRLMSLEVQGSTGMVWCDSNGTLEIDISPYTKKDVYVPKPSKNPDFIWCDWCGSKNHYRDLKCSSCGGTL